MKPTTLLAALSFVLPVATHAADWADMKKNAAKIEVLNMKPTPLVVNNDKDGWARIPPQLDKPDTHVFMPTAAGTNGASDITVLEDGWLIVSCNYDYQGNSSGNWESEVWSESKFKTKGWHPIGKKELGGQLIKTDGRIQVLFSKKVRKGDSFRLRCNKHAPPYPIVLELKP
jgi:hypothetical protein